MKTSPPTLSELREQERARTQRRGLRQLRKTQAIAAQTGIDLSDWEGEFLTSVADRVKSYGRAFADPTKGPPSSAFSVLQTVKLKEIAAKAKGDKGGSPRWPRKAFGRKGGADA